MKIWARLNIRLVLFQLIRQIAYFAAIICIIDPVFILDIAFFDIKKYLKTFYIPLLESKMIFLLSHGI